VHDGSNNKKNGKTHVSYDIYMVDLVLWQQLENHLMCQIRDLWYIPDIKDKLICLYHCDNTKKRKRFHEYRIPVDLAVTH